MASLVGKIKQKVRHRTDSQSSDTSPVTNRAGTRTPERPGSAAHDTPSPSRYDPFPRTSLENSAFHVTRGVPRKSLDSSGRKQVPQSNGRAAAEHQRRLSTGRERADVMNDVPERTSSRFPLQEIQPREHGRGLSAEEHAAADDLVPERGSSKHAETTPPRLTQALPKTPVTPSQPKTETTNQYRTYDLPERPARNGVTTEELSKPLPGVPENMQSPGLEADSNTASLSNSMTNVNWMGPLISTGQQPESAPAPGSDGQPPKPIPASKNDRNAAKYEAMASGNLRLPEGFNLRDTEDTQVYEQVRPAVTQEKIIKQRTEIIQEAITRDIHVHHYYTYVQPIKVVEVLPPRHFRLDPVTGQKVEIPEPPGWTMPVSMQPVSPDASVVKAWSRHYLVSEEYPNGVREDAPEGFDALIQAGLNQSAIAQPAR